MGIYISENNMVLVEKTAKDILDGKLVVETKSDTSYSIIDLLKKFVIQKEILKDSITMEEYADYQRAMKYKFVLHFVKEAWRKFEPVVNTPNLFGPHNQDWKEAWHKFVVSEMYVW